MRAIITMVICGIFLVSILAISGCVAPPQETGASGALGKGNPNNPNEITTTTSSQSSKLLTDVTPFQTQAVPTLGYSTLINPTPIPEDQVCLINFTTFNTALNANKFAKKIDLKNPPMYINYTITNPYVVTGTHIGSTKYAPGTNPGSVSYSYYSPYAYLEIIARDPITGEIFTQDGFGKSFGSSLNKTIQIRKSGNLLIEIGGYNVTSSIGIWMKPTGNFENNTIDLSTLECHNQDYIKRLNQ
jgi:hypothetical protein